MPGIADYHFIERLGSGNHGSFWLADRPDRLTTTSASKVAIKVLDHQATDQDFRRMANELRIYAAIASPYLSPILDAGQQDGTLFYVTRFYESGSLGASTRPLETAETLTCLADASEAAHSLHEAGIAHRDIKPDNIMITDDVRGRLGDLGLAQILTPGQTITGVGPVGTIEYLSPELIRGDNAGRPSDIWAIGATIHRALTGKSLYADLPSNSLLDALRYILENSPDVQASIDPTLRAVVERCLDPDPAARFGTAAEIAAELRKVAAK